MCLGQDRLPRQTFRDSARRYNTADWVPNVPQHAKGRHKPAAIVQDAHSMQAVPVFCMNLPTHHPGLCQMHALKSALDMQVEVEAPSRQRPDEGRVVLGVQISPCAAQGSDVCPPRLAPQLNTTKPTLPSSDLSSYIRGVLAASKETSVHMADWYLVAAQRVCCLSRSRHDACVVCRL